MKYSLLRVGLDTPREEHAGLLDQRRYLEFIFHQLRSVVLPVLSLA